MKQRINFLIAVSIMMLLMWGSVNTSFAKTEDLEGVVMAQDVDKNDISTQVPKGKYVSLDDAEKYVEDKGGNIVVFLQNISKPLAILGMVVCGIMAIISGIFKMKFGPGAWIGVAFIISIIFVAIQGAPVILQLITNTLSV